MGWVGWEGKHNGRDKILYGSELWIEETDNDYLREVLTERQRKETTLARSQRVSKTFNLRSMPYFCIDIYIFFHFLLTCLYTVIRFLKLFICMCLEQKAQ